MLFRLFFVFSFGFFEINELTSRVRIKLIIPVFGFINTITEDDLSVGFLGLAGPGWLAATLDLWRSRRKITPVDLQFSYTYFIYV